MDQGNRESKSFKPLTISVEQLPDSTARAEEATIYAAERARLLLGCYRTGDANDAATYVAAITAILARYPAWVVTSVTHPATGLPSQKNWLPTIKEVADACNATIAPEAEREARAERVRQQLAERERFEYRRPSYEELQEKYGKNFGLGAAAEQAKQAATVPAPNADHLRHHYAHYKLAFEPKDQSEAAE